MERTIVPRNDQKVIGNSFRAKKRNRGAREPRSSCIDRVRDPLKNGGWMGTDLAGLRRGLSDLKLVQLGGFWVLGLERKGKGEKVGRWNA